MLLKEAEHSERLLKLKTKFPLLANGGWKLWRELLK